MFSMETMVEFIYILINGKIHKTVSNFSVWILFVFSRNELVISEMIAPVPPVFLTLILGADKKKANMYTPRSISPGAGYLPRAAQIPLIDNFVHDLDDDADNTGFRGAETWAKFTLSYSNLFRL